jgi:hypothetical protein
MTIAIQVQPRGRALRRSPLLAMLALASAGALAGTPINERAAADAAGQVEISNTAGTVDVTAWPRNEVEVTGELGKGTDRLEFTRTGNVTRVKVILPSKSSRVESSKLVVKVPAGSSLAVNTVSGDIGVHGLRGSQRLQSVSGNIRTEAAAEDVECKTVSGDVSIAGSGQRSLLTVTTVSGDAAVTKVAGEVNGNGAEIPAPDRAGPRAPSCRSNAPRARSRCASAAAGTRPRPDVRRPPCAPPRRKVRRRCRHRR